ncbi:MAG: S-methyl-5'-thioadenosine phosphorylase [Deltaproteobacteria bacterium]|nr:S-methyl-5'-thioadenosine phosphorylase [Deltaproteobacteria bacterium]
MKTVGIIGGSGLYELDGLSDVRQEDMVTPFGAPSSPITIGYIDGIQLLFIARHGEGHKWIPSEINYRANIYALKKLGAQWCISISAVGSLREECAPGDIVVPDQVIDNTRNREGSFFSKGICAHVSFGTPFCPVLREALVKEVRRVAENESRQVHDGGTYVCIEGPAFSSRAESQLYRSWGCSIIGMTNLPEAKLAREAEIAYATLAFVTDYDCWRSANEEVDVATILELLQRNATSSRKIIRRMVAALSKLEPSSLARDALSAAILTSPGAIDERTKRELSPIIGRYI